MRDEIQKNLESGTSERLCNPKQLVGGLQRHAARLPQAAGLGGQPGLEGSRGGVPPSLGDGPVRARRLVPDHQRRHQRRRSEGLLAQAPPYRTPLRRISRWRTRSQSPHSGSVRELVRGVDCGGPHAFAQGDDLTKL